MLSRLKKNSKGFTIIEVMIVLAIAGLIILIVLLAVPALQRNGRNTAIKNDASAIVAGVSEFSSNNDGQIPTAAASSQAAATITIGGAAGTTAVEAKVQGSTTVNFAGTPGDAPGTITVRYGQKCVNATSFGLSDNVRSTAVLYNIETPSAVAPRCIDS